MGIYGHSFDNLINQQKENDILNESTIIIYDKQKKGEIKLYVRDATEKSAGGYIPNDDSVNASQHAASVKLQSPKSITGKDGIPIEIHSGKVDWDEKKFKKLKEINSSDKKEIISFLKKNQEDLNNLYFASEESEKEKYWKSIIDRSLGSIKEISVANDTDNKIGKYFEKKKNGDESYEETKEENTDEG